jgi:GGDEF domain-containing protein
VQRTSSGLPRNYRVAIIVAAIVGGISAITFSASSGDVGGTVWTLSLMGIALGVLVAAAAFSLGTRDQYASAAHEQQDSMNQMQESFESLAGRDWMTGLDTFQEIAKQVERELSRSKRYDRTFTVMFVTPRFEGNTAALTAGHISDIEIYAAEILRKVLRLSDGIARRTDVFGFMALLPETEAAGGKIAGQRVEDGLENPYKVGPWDDQTELIALDAEVLSFPEDDLAIHERFGLERYDPDAPAGTTLPANG